MRRRPSWLQRAGGLRFSCTGCGECCQAADAYVWVTPEEVPKIAACLDLEIDDFGARYLRLVDGDLALVDHPGRDACVFWEKEGGCRVYEARPEQCRTYPFWPENLRSRKDWRAVGQVCPGVGGAGDDARLYTVDEIVAFAGGEGATEGEPSVAGHPEEGRR